MARHKKQPAVKAESREERLEKARAHALRRTPLHTRLNKWALEPAVNDLAYQAAIRMVEASEPNEATVRQATEWQRQYEAGTLGQTFIAGLSRIANDPTSVGFESTEAFENYVRQVVPESEMAAAEYVLGTLRTETEQSALAEMREMRLAEEALNEGRPMPHERDPMATLDPSEARKLGEDANRSIDLARAWDATQPPLSPYEVASARVQSALDAGLISPAEAQRFMEAADIEAAANGGPGGAETRVVDARGASLMLAYSQWQKNEAAKRGLATSIPRAVPVNDKGIPWERNGATGRIQPVTDGGGNFTRVEITKDRRAAAEVAYDVLRQQPRTQANEYEQFEEARKQADALAYRGTALERVGGLTDEKPSRRDVLEAAWETSQARHETNTALSGEDYDRE